MKVSNSKENRHHNSQRKMSDFIKSTLGSNQQLGQPSLNKKNALNELENQLQQKVKTKSQFQQVRIVKENQDMRQSQENREMTGNFDHPESQLSHRISTQRTLAAFEIHEQIPTIDDLRRLQNQILDLNSFSVEQMDELKKLSSIILFRMRNIKKQRFIIYIKILYIQMDKKYQDLFEKKGILENDLKNLEKSIFDEETRYLEETGHIGNVIKGWEGYLSMKNQKLNGNLQRKGKINPQDRIFSQSSKNSTFVQEILQPIQTTGTQKQNFNEGSAEEKKEYHFRRTKIKNKYVRFQKGSEGGYHSPMTSSDEYHEKKGKVPKKF
ncbi:unnamed protein product [Paramecium sonneborni]|uniref:Esa1-associated factor 6 homolog n=1 Tax=Paramecium sonneborni TaxID=65129 RepID=A0A8S1L6A9_9CILI|nr:unnamed protein product [Paramecium sonneborni]